jgi:hypothetical protein
MNGKENILDQLKNNHQQCQNLVLAREWHLRHRSGEMELIRKFLQILHNSVLKHTLKSYF